MSPTHNVNLTLFVIPCFKKNMTIIHLQYCNYCHLLSDFTCKFQSFMTIFNYINVRMQTTPEVDELKISWDDDICELIQKKC